MDWIGGDEEEGRCGRGGEGRRWYWAVGGGGRGGGKGGLDKAVRMFWSGGLIVRMILMAHGCIGLGRLRLRENLHLEQRGSPQGMVADLHAGIRCIG